jgi:hypothetical protein
MNAHLDSLAEPAGRAPASRTAMGPGGGAPEKLGERVLGLPR